MSFEEFFDAFENPEADTPEEATPAEDPVEEEPAQDDTPSDEGENPEEGEAPAEDTAGDDSAEPEEGEGAAGAAEDQKFTVRIGEEDHEYSLAEITDLAKKGAGYDDLQAQLTEATQARDQLQEQINGQQGVMDIMNQIAQSSKKTVEELAKQMYINFRKSAGVSEDAAALELENAQLKKQVDAGKSDAQGDKDSADTQERARKEFAEFRQLHPDVALTDALVAKLKPDVRKGMSLANAYQKMVNEQKAAELAEQERKAKAEAQNKKNRAASPGSQQDSGGRRQKSGFDDFFAQFK